MICSPKRIFLKILFTYENTSHPRADGIAFYHPAYFKRATVYAAVSRFITDSANIIALVDAKIIDGTGGPSKTNQTLIIMNGRIAQIGKAKDIIIPKGCRCY